MEAVINYVFMTLSGLADKYAWLSYTLMAIGGLYVFLTAIRAFLSKIVRLTPTGKDDKIVLMCHSGRRTKLAMEVLKNAGFSNVSDIEGGIYNYSRLGAKLVEYKG